MSEESIFAVALTKTDPAERQAYLDEACAADRSLRARIEALLESHENAGQFLQSPALAEAATMPPDPENQRWPEPTVTVERPGSRIGAYKLLQQLGEGGMGVVYMAEQQEPVRRMVALKIIKPGMDSSQIIARFGAERQALALMDHPNIAKVFDGGSTAESSGTCQSSGSTGSLSNSATGRPYFVMELVKGMPITKFCDERRLSTRERLELFVPVCQAVQHAHQKGIIHRDLKPSNVLVALYDGTPVPKVIDFGVAKAIGQQLTERTLFTDFGAIVGTLEYMSPEQAELNQLDIDTRSDVYSLGVLLYELLTGSTPLDRKRMQSVAIMEVLREIREEEPPKPSTRLSTSDQLASLAAQRNIEPAKLARMVSGDLDCIVMKALDKDRNRRYDTANGLAKDIQRHLNDDPIEARPPSIADRWSRWKRRHPRLVAGYAAAKWMAVLLLIVGGVAYFYRQQAASYEQNYNQARDEWLRNQGLLSFFTEAVFRQQDPKDDQAKQILAAALDRGAGQLELRTYFVKGEEELIHQYFARCYEALGEYARAEPHWRRACTTGSDTMQIRGFGRFQSAQNPAVSRKMGLGKNLTRQGKLEEAEVVLREALSSMDEMDSFSRENGFQVLGVSDERLNVAFSYADLLVLLGRHREAKGVLENIQHRAIPGEGFGWNVSNGFLGFGGESRLTHRTPITHLKKVYDRLAECCDALGEPAEAARWRKELERVNVKEKK